jgi:hypothetical protein
MPSLLYSLLTDRSENTFHNGYNSVVVAQRYQLLLFVVGGKVLSYSVVSGTIVDAGSNIPAFRRHVTILKENVIMSMTSYSEGYLWTLTVAHYYSCSKTLPWSFRGKFHFFKVAYFIAICSDILPFVLILILWHADLMDGEFCFRKSK